MGVIKFLMTDLGVMAGMTQSLDPATCIAVAEGFGKVVGGPDTEEAEEYVDGIYISMLFARLPNTVVNNRVDLEESALSTGFVAEDDDDESLLVARPPVVTIMGHVGITISVTILVES